MASKKRPNVFAYFARLANQSARKQNIPCAHCGDRASTIGPKGEPACAECAVELETGKPPPMEIITSR